jgi:hypothetical protein
MPLTAKDINGKDFSAGSSVAVRCTVLSINPISGNPAAGAIGSGDRITVQVSSPGNVGEVTPGPIFTISPVQCQFSQSNAQLKGN